MKSKKTLILAVSALLMMTACGKNANRSSDSDAATENSSSTGKEAMNIELSDTVYFGMYPQNNEEPQPIEWIVLDQQDDKALLLAKNVLDAHYWHKTRTPVTWDQCDLRNWLNNEFLSTAFDDTQQAALILTELDNGDDLGYGTEAGQKTQDKVFLLSGSQVEQYLSEESRRTAQATNYAVSQGVYTNDEGNCAWWLRSPGVSATSAAYIASPGNFGNRAHEVDETIIGVRPAVWVNKESLR